MRRNSIKTITSDFKSDIISYDTSYRDPMNIVGKGQEKY